MMLKYGFKNSADIKKTNTTNLYEALIDDSIAAPEMDSKIGGQTNIGDFSAIGNTMNNDARGIRRFGIG
jgi:hypothetical protein